MSPEQQKIIDDLRFSREEISITEHTRNYLRHIEKEYANGGIRLFKFGISNPDNQFFLYQNDSLSDIISSILRSPNLSKHLEEITAGKVVKDLPLDIKQGTIFSLLGMLSGIAQSGGAYSPHGRRLSDEQAIDLAKNFLFDLLPGTFNDYYYFSTGVAWTDWFFDVCWDSTSMIFNKKYDELILIVMTDTD